jgi:hypothetical protein
MCWPYILGIVWYSIHSKGSLGYRGNPPRPPKMQKILFVVIVLTTKDNFETNYALGLYLGDRLVLHTLQRTPEL